MENNQISLRLEGVTKRFDEFTAVDNLDMTVRKGRIYGLLGPNGAGKTTSIRMIVNITVPDNGTIELLGQPMSPALQDRIGYLPEERGLYKRMKIGEQLHFFAALKNIGKTEAGKRIDRWLDQMRLAEWKNKKATELSKGMQQKIQFIAAVIHEPDFLILDEPFSGLDPVNVELLKEIVLGLKAAGKTIIFSTHMMELAEKICDDICLINRSKKILEGTLREVKAGFGRNAVALRINGGEAVLDDWRLVASTKHSADEIEVMLTDGADAQELLTRLIAAGAQIGKFERVESSLNDIFIEMVGGNQ